MDLLLVVAHPQGVAHYQSGCALGSESSFVGSPTGLVGGLVRVHFLHLWYLRLFLLLCFLRWGFAYQCVPSPLRAFLLAPAPAPLPRYPILPEHVSGAGLPSGTGWSDGFMIGRDLQNILSSPAERMSTSWCECAVICRSGKYPCTAWPGIDGTNDNLCHRCRTYHIWCIWSMQWLTGQPCGSWCTSLDPYAVSRRRRVACYYPWYLVLRCLPGPVSLYWGDTPHQQKIKSVSGVSGVFGVSGVSGSSVCLGCLR